MDHGVAGVLMLKIRHATSRGYRPVDPTAATALNGTDLVVQGSEILFYEISKSFRGFAHRLGIGSAVAGKPLGFVYTGSYYTHWAVARRGVSQSEKNGVPDSETSDL